jgi:chromosome segregation ATPase
LLIPKSLASETPPNYLTKIQRLEEKLNRISQENSDLKTELACEEEQNTNLQQDLKNSDEQNATLRQEKSQIIIEKNQTQQELTAARQTIASLQEQLFQERKISTEQKQINNNFHQQLQTERKTNTNLTQKLSQQEQNHTNLQNAYQIALKNKAKAELYAQREKQKADHYENQLKSIVQTLYQWQKLNYYKQLGKQNKTEAKIVQLERPPPWRNK